MKKLIFTLTTLVLCLTLIGGISALAADSVYPDGMTMETFESYGEGAIELSGLSGTWGSGSNGNTSSLEIVKDSENNKYLQVTTNAPTSDNAQINLRYPVSHEYIDSEDQYIDSARYLYFTAEIAGWQDDYIDGNFAIYPQVAESTKAGGSAAHLSSGGVLYGSGKKSSIDAYRESTDHFYKIDMIIDTQDDKTTNAPKIYTYIDGTFIGSYSDTSSAITVGKSFKYFWFNAQTDTGNQRSYRLDNLGYRAYPSSYTVDKIVEEIFATPDLRYVGGFTADSISGLWRTYVRAAAVEKAGILLLAVYNEEGQMVEVTNLCSSAEYSKNNVYKKDISKSKNPKTVRAFFLNNMGTLIPLDESIEENISEWVDETTQN